MKRNVTFVDAIGSKAEIEIKISDKGTLTMSGNYQNGSGQCLDNIQPRTEAQTELIDIWKKWHLNDMKPGTPKQMELVKGLKYDDAVELLGSTLKDGVGKIAYGELVQRIAYWNKELEILEKWKETSETVDVKYYTDEKENYSKALKIEQGILESTLLYDVLPNGDLYEYGTGWLTEELPQDIETTIDGLIETIEEEEEERKGEPLSGLDDGEIAAIIMEHDDVDEDNIDEYIALINMFDLSYNDLDDISFEGDDIVSVQGIEYLFGDDATMDEYWDESLDGYLEDCVFPELPESMRGYFDVEAWKSDARMDGRAHSLNYYDGGEENYRDYYAYRR